MFISFVHFLITFHLQFFIHSACLKATTSCLNFDAPSCIPANDNMIVIVRNQLFLNRLNCSSLLFIHPLVQNMQKHAHLTYLDLMQNSYFSGERKNKTNAHIKQFGLLFQTLYVLIFQKYAKRTFF